MQDKYASAHHTQRELSESIIQTFCEGNSANVRSAEKSSGQCSTLQCHCQQALSEKLWPPVRVTLHAPEGC